MAKRKGAAKGSGSGYKNLPNYPKDPMVHSMSGKGMKQPQIPENVMRYIQTNPDAVKAALNKKTTLDDIKFDDDAVEVVRTEKGMVRIFPDTDPESPREWDNLGNMFFFHKRYNLGDPHSETSDMFGSWQETADYLKKEKGAAIILPVYMYDHSGLRVKVGSFQGYLPQGHAEFDSGMIGYIYVTKEQIKKEYGKVNKSTMEKAERVLRGEVETYDQYLSGDVWGFSSYDNQGNEVEAVWGYYGMDTAIEEGKATL